MSNEQSAGHRDPDQEPENTEQQSSGEGESVAEADPAIEEESAEEHEVGQGDEVRETDEREAEIERLRAALEAAEARADENWQRVLRTEAEKENIRKRAERDVESAHKYGVEKMANELLAVRDSLELGLDAARQEDADIAKVREGTELTLRMLTQAMEKFGIEEIDPQGQKFDPELHQAMSMQEAEGHESNTVFQVMQKGYRLKERLLRPALVMVAK